MKDLWHKHHLIILLLAAMIFLIIAVAIFRGQDTIMRVTHWIVMPFEKIFSSISDFFARFFEKSSNVAALQRERDELALEVTQLKRKEFLLEETRDKLRRVQELVRYKEREDNWETAFASVIARNPDNWLSELVIDLGEDDGVAVGMNVITLQEEQVGLVGTVMRVTKHSAFVHLLIDPKQDLAVAARVEGRILGEEEAFFDGVVEGTSGKNNYLQMTYISHEAVLEPGASVWSSGLGSGCVADIPIGEIVSTETDQYGLLQKAVIRPHIDFTRISEVLVIISPLPTGGAGNE